ncbi:MAG: hypothetical protein IPN76_29550 [Saprospiraceae bacterium]|nr:hypothetical protein [Saprospiraceae bacterium]
METAAENRGKHTTVKVMHKKGGFKPVMHKHLIQEEGRAFDELQGKGIWHFSHENGVTTVQYDWLVNTTKAWLNLLAPIARPIFSWNHDKVMEAGYVGLKERLVGAV